MSCEVRRSLSRHHDYQKRKVLCLVRCAEADLGSTVIKKKEGLCVL